MFDALWRAQRARRNLDKFYSRSVTKAAREKNYEKERTLAAEHMFERDLVTDRIDSLETTAIMEEAERVGIPVPKYSPDSEAWEKGCQPDRVHLGRKFVHDLRTQIRKERRERIEYWVLILKDVVMTLVGLFGSIIALVSVLRSLRGK